MQKTLILVRHAHRDNSRRELDNGLDDKGRDQAKALKKFFSERFSKDAFEGGLWLVSSPKVRCLETLEPIAKSVERKVDAHPALDEQGGRETAAAFEARVAAFLKEWRASHAAYTILCSHGDWLPAALRLLMGVGASFKKGSWLEIEWDGESPELKWYIPTFKYFGD